MLIIPDYIQTAKITTIKLDFKWDEWRVREYYVDFTDEDFNRFGKLTGRACAAIAFATGEWILHRFSLLNNDDFPNHFLEAAWAANVHIAYFPFTETDDDDWRGPVRSPLNMMMAIAGDAHFAISDDPDLQSRSLWMRNLARHVLPNTTAFDKWFETCIQRLERFHPKDQTEEEDLFSDLPEGMGKPVPREAFDPNFKYDPSQDVALIDSFLRNLQPQINPLLVKPDGLKDIEELKGSIYRYFG